MKNIPAISRAYLVQSCINCYYDENNKGFHGDLDWSYIKGGREGITPFDIGNNEGYMCVANIPGIGETGLVAYEGSSGDRDGGVDWKKNFDAKMVEDIKKSAESHKEFDVPYGNTDTRIRMHKGFAETYMEARDLTREFAEWCVKQGLRYTVTGHSLGGAVATLDFIDKQYLFRTEMNLGRDKIDITGYAAATPAVFNGPGKDSFNKRSDGDFYNEWYGGDTVHKVPPFWMGYWHVGVEKRYADFGTNLYLPLDFIPFLRMLPAWDHDPRRLHAAILGKPIPMAKLDSRK